MIEASCHCGAVQIAVPSAPETLTACNCSPLPAESAGFGPIIAPRDVTVSGETDSYIWGDR